MKVIGIAGWSGAGKTTLISRVIPYLREQGLRVSVIKHAHHDFDVDVPGKDSWVHRQSGAEEVLVLVAESQSAGRGRLGRCRAGAQVLVSRPAVGQEEALGMRTELMM